jgi:predicted HD superfamily hydrolase involved in NAD metabolism
MSSIEDYKDTLRTYLSGIRFDHCLKVSEFSKELGLLHGVDEKKAEMAGLLHDCAKELGPEEMKQQLDRVEVKQFMDAEELACRGVWHAYVGAVYARDKFGVVDDEVLSAIRTHSVGEPEMSDLQAIVYVADACAPRNKEHQAQRVVLLEIARKDLWKGVLAVATFKIGLGEEMGTVPLRKGLELKTWLEHKISL